MKALINDMIYDTDTATPLATSREDGFWDDGLGLVVTNTLYVTKQGRYFIAQRTIDDSWMHRAVQKVFGIAQRTNDTIFPMSKITVRAWCFKNQIEPSGIGIPEIKAA